MLSYLSTIAMPSCADHLDIHSPALEAMARRLLPKNK